MKILLSIYTLSLLMLCGCSQTNGISNLLSNDRTAVSNHDPICLWNLQQGREYVMQGRYELAKEHYLMALAASNNDQTQALVAHELHAVDIMIKTTR